MSNLEFTAEIYTKIAFLYSFSFLQRSLKFYIMLNNYLYNTRPRRIYIVLFVFKKMENPSTYDAFYFNKYQECFMRKPEYLIRFKAPYNTLVGCIYVDSDDGVQDTFRVQVKTTESPDWKVIPVEEFHHFKDGVTTTINLQSNEAGVRFVRVRSSLSGSSNPVISFNDWGMEVECLEIGSIKFDDMGNPLLNPDSGFLKAPSSPSWWRDSLFSVPPAPPVPTPVVTQLLDFFESFVPSRSCNKPGCK